MLDFCGAHHITGDVEVIDMQPAFIADYRQRQLTFEFPDDNHWNATGHEVFARAVQQSKVYRETFRSVGP